MKNIIQVTQVASTIIGGFLGWLLGGLDGFMYTLLIFVILDYVTALMLAVLEKKLSSSIGYRGIFKKVIIFALVGVGNIIDVYILQNGSAIRTAVVFFYITNEGISILENIGKIGLPIPDALKNVLDKLNNNGGRKL